MLPHPQQLVCSGRSWEISAAVAAGRASPMPAACACPPGSPSRLPRPPTQERLAKLQQSGAKSRSNKSNAPWDILTLEYRTSPEGQQLKQQVRAGRGEVRRGVPLLLCVGVPLPDRERHGAPSRRSAWGSSFQAAADQPGWRRCPPQDDVRRQQRACRAQRLYERNNTTTHNILNGQPVRLPAAGDFSPV